MAHFPAAPVLLTIVVLGFFSLLLGTGAAQGAIGPTPEEDQAIRATAQCDGLVMVSTVDPRWARIDCDDGYVVGTLVLSRSTSFGSDWERRAAALSHPFSCTPYAIGPLLAADLGDVCRPAPRHARWPRLGGMGYKPAEVPQGAHGLYRLRWLSWTASSAHGRGVLDYGDLYSSFRVAVRVRLYRPRRCPTTGVTIFTRRRVTAVRARERRLIAFETKYTVIGSCAENADDFLERHRLQLITDSGY